MGRRHRSRSHFSMEPQGMSGREPNCIECGRKARLVGGQRIYPHRRDLYNLKFYLCECGAYCGTHKGTTKALGFPCGPETRRARKQAHASFDPLWKGGKMERREAYSWLAEQLNVDPDKCHIGMMDAKHALLTVKVSLAMRGIERVDQKIYGKTPRKSKWQGQPTGEGNPPWVTA